MDLGRPQGGADGGVQSLAGEALAGLLVVPDVDVAQRPVFLLQRDVQLQPGGVSSPRASMIVP